MAKPLPIPELLQVFTKYSTQATKPAADPEADTVVPLPAKKPSDPDPTENTVRMAPISHEMLSKLDSTPGPIAIADEDTDAPTNEATAESTTSESEEAAKEEEDTATTEEAAEATSTESSTGAEANEDASEDDDEVSEEDTAKPTSWSLPKSHLDD